MIVKIKYKALIQMMTFNDRNCTMGQHSHCRASSTTTPAPVLTPAPACNRKDYGEVMVDNPNKFVTNVNVTSQRQSVEWGMNMLHASFPQLEK